MALDAVAHRYGTLPSVLLAMCSAEDLALNVECASAGAAGRDRLAQSAIANKIGLPVVLVG